MGRFELYRFFATRTFAVFIMLSISLGAKVSKQEPSQAPQAGAKSLPISLEIWTDHAKYSPQGTLKLSASLHNMGDKAVYIDRRMFWTGLGGGLELEIRDADGKLLPARMLSDAIMPPPKEGDDSILIRLDEGFFYGTSVNLLVKDFFPKPGRYSLQVIYKSALHKEFVSPQLRKLPALWADSPEIRSKPVSVDVTG